MVHVRSAVDADIDQLVELQQHLFDQDAGVHGTLTDLTWPTREGRADFKGTPS